MTDTDTLFLIISLALFVIAILGALTMNTLADVSAKLDTVQTNVAALQAALAAAPTQQAVDALAAKADALVTASTPPTPSA